MTMEVGMLLLLMVLLVFVFAIAFVGLIVLYVMSGPPNMTRYESEKYFMDKKTGGSKKLFPSLYDHSSIDLTVVVPSYNEEERLPVMIDEALEYLESRKKNQPKFRYEIIVVDDGSTDKTTEVALGYTDKCGSDTVRVLTLAQNRGKGGAVRLGMLSGRGKLLLFADADGATKFSDYTKVEDHMKEINTRLDGRAVVCGSRAHLEKESIAQRSIFRTFLMYGFHTLVYILCVRGIKDTQCGFKLLTRPAAQLLFTNLHVDRWAFDVDMLHIAQTFEIPIGEEAVTWQEIEGSKMVPVWSWLQMGKDLLLIRLRYLTGAWHMKHYKEKMH